MKLAPTTMALFGAVMFVSVAQAQTAPGAAAAGGDANQAIATTHADAPQPARGANSFTRGQATARLKKHGFADIGALTKDHGGVWRGSATRDGAPVQVWVDYKGNVGQQ